MTDDGLIRLVLVTGLVVLIPILATYRVRAHGTGEPLDRRQEGWFILIGLRLTAAVRMAGLVAWLIDPAWMAWSAVPLPLGLRWAALGLGAIGGVTLVWTFHTLGKNLTDTVVTRRDATLVTAGPYRWVRHPFYASLALMLAADSLATANAFVAVGGMALMAFLVARTRIEEAKLIERFGDDYRRYMARTGRFFPR